MHTARVTSIVIPAHNEGRVIGRLLDALLADTSVSGPDIVVVCNGCTDDTARVAGGRGDRVRVIEIPTPSKHQALRVGDEHARGFPRLYVDADVVVGAADVRALVGALERNRELLAAAPGRDIPLGGCAWPVRAYYRVWQRLPAVREGLFGRGVIAVTEAGHARLAALPPLMADDLAASLAFGPGERRVVEGARVVVRPPRTWSDLIRRRVRAATSSAEFERFQAARRAEVPEEARAAEVPERAPGPRPDRAPEPVSEQSARTGTADLRALLWARPALLPGVVVFVVAALVARRGSRKAIRDQDFSTWLRDESSRQG
ncbi:glycosyl transferase family 2 [Streptomyces sp. CG 926]|nr:glycosyl transferase family 2 [Streptomyces sp. CG 926]